MKERPILFQGAMVRAILAGGKTQTRRVMSVQPDDETAVHVGLFHQTVVDRLGDEHPGPEVFGAWWHDGEWGLRCPFGRPGDQLWVRETLKPWSKDADLFAYAADDTKVESDAFNYPVKPGRRYVPSIHLDRCWSRIQLEITAVRVERLQEISEADARAEGAACVDEASGREVLFPDASQAGSWRLGYRALWEQINGPGSWDANPWVWVVAFRRITP